ncbi:MAG: hypothetical protein FWE07_06320 [Turicibacter sp.]|nr:hypothetical protein [Turicibacter sp.]
MRKLLLAGILAIAIFFSVTNFDLFANQHVDEEQVLALLEEGTVVVSNGHIHHLSYMSAFYQNARWHMEDEIVLIVDPYTVRAREYELRTIDGRLLLTSIDLLEEASNHSVTEHVRLFRIFRGQEIHYVLECSDGHEYILFGHLLN